jgi:bifunctional enzyme CysN/CysC
VRVVSSTTINPIPWKRKNVKAISSSGISADIAATARDELRFLTCGSVDDGKSTLIGRLLLDAALVLDDHMRSLARDSREHGTVDDELDAALLMDGLEAEREQGITIDVAYRYFGTACRRFVVADTPGHMHYTRNMVTGASTSDLAILLVDAEKGLLEQTRRHGYLCALLGIRHFVLAVNKMDLVDFNEQRFEAIYDGFAQFARSFSLRSLVAIPTCARFGDNVVRRGTRMPWYQGPSLLDHLEGVQIDEANTNEFLRLPVQYVNRPNAAFRGYAGTIASGTLRPGAEIIVSRSGERSKVARIVTMDGDLDQAVKADAVTVLLADELDISRGDILTAPDKRPQRADAFAAHLVWMVKASLFPGRAYLLKCGAQTVSATVTELKYRVDIEDFRRLAAKELHLNEIAFVNIATREPISFDPYDDNRETGGFILIDRFSNATVGAGMIRFGLHRAENTHWQLFDVNKETRAVQKAQKPAVLWFTGLSGAGKSTIANILEKKLHALDKHTFVLDGDNVRHGLNRDLGFTEADRVENIRRVTEVAKLFVDAGLITIVAFISPFRAERQMARDLMQAGEFVEIFVDTPIEVCEQRDPKGLYRKARRGELHNFTGIDSPYEPPLGPEIRLAASKNNPETLADQIIHFLRQYEILG